MTPRLLSASSTRARTGDTVRSECPAMLQNRAAYSSARPGLDHGEQKAEPGVQFGTDGSTIATTSMTMMDTISRANREPPKCGRWLCSSSS